jgi:hypothetical protein
MKFLSALFLAMCGCSALKKEPMPEDTVFNEDRRDWIEVYRHEISIAIENKDLGAIKFFSQEIEREEREK